MLVQTLYSIFGFLINRFFLNIEKSYRLSAQEEFSNLWIGQQIITFSGNGQFPGNQNISDVGKLQTFFGVLLDHDDGFAFVVLEVMEDFEETEEMASWEVEPSMEHYVYGALAAALESLEEGVHHLLRGAEATPETVHQAWKAQQRRQQTWADSRSFS